MADISKAYRRLMNRLLPEDKLAALYEGIDREAMTAFSESGYSWEEIKSGLVDSSFYLGRLDDAGIAGALAKILPAGIEAGRIAALSSDKAGEMRRIYQEVRERHEQEIASLFAPADQEALNSLLDQGFSERDAHEFMQDDGYFVQQIKESQYADRYANNLFRAVAEERGIKADADIEECEKAAEEFSKFLGSTQDKATGWNFHAEGQVAIYLLVQEKYMPETVYDVMDGRLHSYERAPVDELEKLMEKAQQVKNAYLSIEEAPAFGQGKSPVAVYRSYLKRYMAEKGCALLSFADEQAVIRQMLEDGFPQKFLPQAIQKGSPVAKEPGRLEDKYIEALLYDGEVKETTTAKADVSALDMYKNRLESFDKDFRRSGHDGGITGNFRKYFDCLVTMSLIRKNCTDEEIETAILEGNPHIEKGREHSYAQDLLEKARRLIQKQQEWLEKVEEKLPTGKTFKELLALEYTVQAIWKYLLQERLALNPSYAGQLWQKGVDRDIAETCLLRYPDIDRKALHDVIGQSPRAILLEDTGLAEASNYADEIIDSVVEQMAENAAQLAEEDALEEEYSRQIELSAEGLEIDTVNEYQCGQGALQLMMHGYDTLAIRNALLKKTSQQNIKSKSTGAKSAVPYVDGILQRVRNAYSRILTIKAYEQGKDVQENAAEAEYKAEMKKLWQKNKVMRPADDESIMARLLAHHKKELVIAALLACSPWTAMPGVSGLYVEHYLMRKAQQEILNAQRRLAKEKPRVRERKSDSISEDYREEREAIQKRHTLLPYSMKMDELVAISLLMAGWNTLAVGRVLDEESPCRESQQNYGVSVANRAHKAVFSTITVEEENRNETWAGIETPTRRRTITETVYTGGVNG